MSSWACQTCALSLVLEPSARALSTARFTSFHASTIILSTEASRMRPAGCDVARLLWLSYRVDLTESQRSPSFIHQRLLSFMAGEAEARGLCSSKTPNHAILSTWMLSHKNVLCLEKEHSAFNACTTWALKAQESHGSFLSQGWFRRYFLCTLGHKHSLRCLHSFPSEAGMNLSKLQRKWSLSWLTLTLTFWHSQDNARDHDTIEPPSFWTDKVPGGCSNFLYLGRQ